MENQQFNICGICKDSHPLGEDCPLNVVHINPVQDDNQGNNQGNPNIVHNRPVIEEEKKEAIPRTRAIVSKKVIIEKLKEAKKDGEAQLQSIYQMRSKQMQTRIKNLDDLARSQAQDHIDNIENELENTLIQIKREFDEYKETAEEEPQTNALIRKFRGFINTRVDDFLKMAQGEQDKLKAEAPVNRAPEGRAPNEAPVLPQAPEVPEAPVPVLAVAPEVPQAPPQHGAPGAPPPPEDPVDPVPPGAHGAPGGGQDRVPERTENIIRWKNGAFEFRFITFNVYTGVIYALGMFAAWKVTVEVFKAQEERFERWVQGLRDYLFRPAD